MLPLIVDPKASSPRVKIGEGDQVTDLYALIGALPVPMVIHALSDDGVVHFINRSFTETFGYTLEHLPTLSAGADLVFPDPVYRSSVMTDWRAEIEAARASGALSKPREYRFVDRTGRPRDVLIGFALLGELVIVTFEDQTDVRAAQAALEAEQDRNEKTAFALTENMPAGAYTMVLRPGGAMAEFAFLSRQFLKMLDLTQEEAVGDPMTAFSRVHPDDRPRWLEMNANAFTNRLPFKEECRIVAYGWTRWIRAESFPRDLGDGAIIWEGVLVDITELKEAERRLNDVLSAANAFTWKLDLRKNSVVFNTAWALTHGYQPDEIHLTFDDWLGSLHPEDAPSVITAFNKLRAGEVVRQTATYRRQHDSGHWIWLQVHAGISERDSEGKPVALSGVSFDITPQMNARAIADGKQAQLREDLQRAQQRDTVAQIAGGVAHDLNNLIAVVAGTVEMLESQANEQQWLQEGLGRIQRSVNMARDLIAGLGGIVRPDLQRLSYDLGALVRDGVDLLGPRRVAEHAVRLVLTDDPIPVWANPTEIAQVIVNLGINACDSGSSGRPAEVTITTHPAGTIAPQRPPDAGAAPIAGVPFALFTICDTGIGITDDVRARMFRPNFTTKGKAGTGLGLLIVSNILQSNRAALWVDSKPGEGTCVTVAWPTKSITQTDPNAVSASQQTQTEVTNWANDRLRGMHILVVDDLVDVAEVLASMLEAAGAVAVAISDPKEAAEALTEAPDLWAALVTDLHMPEMDGRALAHHAANLPLPVPTVLVTARPDMLGDRPADEFSDVLAKPVTALQLVSAVLKAADGRKSA